jgi:CheY-like chemotaxis protein
MKKINHVLLVDDEILINLINTRVIEMSNQVTKITALSSAEESLELLNNIIAKNPSDFPEYIFLDINMPDMDGWEFLQHFEQFPKQIIAQCSVILLTSSIDRSDIKKAKLNPLVYDYLSKPLSLENFSSVTSSSHETYSLS